MAMTYNLKPTRRSALGDIATSALEERMTGSPSAGMRAKFREMDEATGRANADMLATTRTNMPGLGSLGQGAAIRGYQTAQNEAAQQVAANKLKQAQMAGTEQESALDRSLAVGTAEDASRERALDRLVSNAKDIGDSTTAGALQGVFAERGGIGYTPEAMARMKEDARLSASDESALRNSLDENERIRRRSSRPSRGSNILSAMAGGAAAGSPYGPGGAAIGAGLGAGASLLTSIF
jgi:hypothetical protein